MKDRKLEDRKLSNGPGSSLLQVPLQLHHDVEHRVVHRAERLQFKLCVYFTVAALVVWLSHGYGSYRMCAHTANDASCENDVQCLLQRDI